MIFKVGDIIRTTRPEYFKIQKAEVLEVYFDSRLPAYKVLILESSVTFMGLMVNDTYVLHGEDLDYYELEDYNFSKDLKDILDE